MPPPYRPWRCKRVRSRTLICGGPERAARLRVRQAGSGARGYGGLSQVRTWTGRLHEGIIVRQGRGPASRRRPEGASPAIEAALMETAASARANDDAKSSPVEDHLCFRCKYLPDGISKVIDKDGVCVLRQDDGPRCHERRQESVEKGWRPFCRVHRPLHRRLHQSSAPLKILSSDSSQQPDR